MSGTKTDDFMAMKGAGYLLKSNYRRKGCYGWRRSSHHGSARPDGSAG